jgi:hypothetical protein
MAHGTSSFPPHSLAKVPEWCRVDTALFQTAEHWQRNWRICMNISNTLRRRLARPEFPRASSYDPDWVFETMMGRNALWLVEWASQAVSK